MRAQLKIVAVCLVGLIFLGGCQTTIAPPAQDAGLASKLDPIWQASGADVGVRVVDLGSGRELYARQADRPMMPASNLKLVTTATALDLFGPEYRFQTRLGMSGDDLYLIGGGDPAPRPARSHGPPPGFPPGFPLVGAVLRPAPGARTP